MPKITINEFDYTGSGNELVLNQTVLIPGVAATNSGLSINDEPILLESTSDLYSIIGEDVDDLGYKIAELLLGVGMTVLYAVAGVGSTGLDETSTTRFATWWEKFKDKSAYSLRFITTGSDDDAKAAEYAAGVAKARGDAVSLLYIPHEIAKDYSTAYAYVNATNGKVLKGYEWTNVQAKDDAGRPLYYFDSTGTDRTGTTENVEDDVMKPVMIKVLTKTETQSELTTPSIDAETAKYVAGFVPNFSLVKGDGSELHLPGYVAYLGCFATYVNRFASWFAFAGAARGLIPWNIRFDANFGELAIDKLQDRKTAGVRALNPICNIRNYGNLVWGNRTLYPVTTADGSTVAGLTASSFLNIRMLISDIKNHLYNVSRRYTFDPNSSLLWTRFYNSVVPLLEDMKTNQGIRGYKLTQVKDAPRATLRAVLRIIPIEAVEDFEFYIELADSIEVTEE